jgi:hypothetical protein
MFLQRGESHDTNFKKIRTQCQVTEKMRYFTENNLQIQVKPNVKAPPTLDFLLTIDKSCNFTFIKDVLNLLKKFYFLAFQLKYLRRLKAIRATLDSSDFFVSHEVNFFYTSLSNIQVVKLENINI